MMLSDSNLIIYAASKKYPALMDWFEKNKPAASAISLVEVLGYHKLQAEEKRALEALFAELTIFYPTPEIFQIAVELRQKRAEHIAGRKRAVGLGEIGAVAPVLAGAEEEHLDNTKDFDPIKPLEVIDPMRE